MPFLTDKKGGTTSKRMALAVLTGTIVVDTACACLFTQAQGLELEANPLMRTIIASNPVLFILLKAGTAMLIASLYDRMKTWILWALVVVMLYPAVASLLLVDAVLR